MEKSQKQKNQLKDLKIYLMGVGLEVIRLIMIRYGMKLRQVHSKDSV
jgi:hypothetical protein